MSMSVNLGTSRSRQLQLILLLILLGMLIWLYMGGTKKDGVKPRSTAPVLVGEFGAAFGVMLMEWLRLPGPRSVLTRLRGLTRSSNT